MENAGIVPEVGLFTPIIEGTDGTGRKMSKSLGNAIPVLASLEDKFGKVMSIPDHLILPWFKAFTFVHESELPEIETFIGECPLVAKKMLGVLLIALETKNLEAGEEEKVKFERKFSRKSISDDDCENIQARDNVFLSLRVQFTSSSELRRLFDQRAVRTHDGTVLTGNESVTGIVRVGKRRLFKIQ